MSERVFEKVLFSTITIIIFIILIALLQSCCQKSQKVKTVIPTDNSDYQVSQLFTINGCKIYRFIDAEHYKYFTDCRGSVTSQYSQQEGKVTLTKTEEIQTVTK